MMTPVLHAPPAVRFALRPGTRLRAFLYLPGLVSGLLLLGWGWQGMHAHPWLASSLAAGAWMLAAAVAWTAERRHPRGWLGWDGQEWFWHLSGQASMGASEASRLERPPEVGWDGQSFVWVALSTADGRRVWCLLDRDADPLRWPDLRRALYFRPKPSVPADVAAAAQGPGASPN